MAGRKEKLSFLGHLSPVLKTAFESYFDCIWVFIRKFDPLVDRVMLVDGGEAAMLWKVSG